MATKAFSFSVDRDANTIEVSRQFDARRELVWAAWTEAEHLDRWWGPEPYRAQTKELEFRVGGRWLYAMVGPEGVVGYSRANFTSITPISEFRSHSSFCDAEGQVTPGWKGSEWWVRFTPVGDATRVDVQIKYPDLAGMEKILEMGFRGGFTQGLDQLDKLLTRN